MNMKPYKGSYIDKSYKGDYIDMYTLASRLSILKPNEVLTLTYQSGAYGMQKCVFTRVDDDCLVYHGVQQTISFCEAIPLSANILELIVEDEPLTVSFKAFNMRYKISCDEEYD